MTTKRVLTYPDPQLRVVSALVPEVTDEVLRLVDDLAETMYVTGGQGLSAPQIGVHQRVFVTDTADPMAAPDLRAFVNPRIVVRSDANARGHEGCLSFPGVHEPVERSAKVTVWAWSRDGKPFAIDASGLLAVAIQHELDHLDGVLFVDHLSNFVRRRIDRALKKRH